MKEVMKMVRTGEVTMAVRDTTLNGVKIKKDNFISILDGKIISCKSSYLEAKTKHLIKKARLMMKPKLLQFIMVMMHLNLMPLS